MVRSLRLLLVFAALGLPALAVAETFDRAIAAAAARWLEAAGPAGEGASFAFSDRERRDWHFTPRGREGLMIGDMSRAQREATTALMRATLSSPGVLKAQDIMRLEAVLAEVEGSSLRYRNPEGYYVSVFGDPNGYPWGWRLEGHHLSINVTIAAPNEAFVTPLFTGTNPAVPPSDSGFAKVIQQDEMTLAFRLIRSLDPEQAAAARLSSSPRNIVTGPGSGDALDRWAGIMGGGLTDGQRSLLRQLVSVDVGMARDEVGQTYMRLFDEGLAETSFAWAGEASERAAFYYRIHGPRILIEFDNTRGGNHIHAIWRDPLNDFGRDALRQHYADSPHRHDDWP